MKTRMFIILIIIILIVSFSSVGVAEGLNIEGEIKSRIEIDLKEYQIPLLSNKLELDLSYYSSRSGLAKAIVEVSDQESNKIKLKEIYTELYLSHTDLRIGKQKIMWGKADGINPTNNFNPEDLTRPFSDDNKIAVPAVRAEHYYQDWIFDLVWVPGFTAPNFGGPNNRWSTFLSEEPVMPVDKLENSDFGLKVSRWNTKIDFSLSYFRGYSKLPYISKKRELTFYRVNVFGGDFAKDFNSFVMRGEGAYFQPIENHENKKPYYKIVIGVDKELTDKLYINTQYYRQKEENIDLEQKFILGTEFDITNFQKIGINTVYNINDGDHVINPTYSVDIRDNLSLDIEGYIFAGDKKTEFGRYDNKDYCYIELQKNF